MSTLETSNGSDSGVDRPFAGLAVGITGVAGTVGKEMLRQVLDGGAAEVIGIDSNEGELFFLRQNWSTVKGVHLYLGDLHDRAQLEQRFEDIDIIVHAAALKQVPLCEESPTSAIETNIIGTQNVIDAAIAANVGRVLLTSSDKAVNPTSVMGTSKLMAERLMTAANSERRGAEPIFTSTRFGNVLGSRGSVLPLFAEQITAGGPVTLTDRAMTRFVMSLEHAVTLVLRSAFLAKGGEVFVPKMPVARIEDLASVLIEAFAPVAGHRPADIAVVETGSRPGEKFYEELMSGEEVRRSTDMGNFLAIWPALQSRYRKDQPIDSRLGEPVTHPYNSEEERAMTREELRAYLHRHALIPHDAAVSAVAET